LTSIAPRSPIGEARDLREAAAGLQCGAQLLLSLASTVNRSSAARRHYVINYNIYYLFLNIYEHQGRTIE
jgi:hypothetical protein